MRKRKQMSSMSSRVSRAPSTPAAQELGENVVAGLLLALVEDVVEVLVDLLAGLVGDPDTGFDVVGLGAGPEDAVLQAEQNLELFPWQAHELQEDRRRVRHREVVVVFALAPLDDRVDEAVGSLGDGVLERFHSFRGEQGVEKLSVF